jgi:hypothetical protein
MRRPRALAAQAAPLIARLIASVPPLVKTISRGLALASVVQPQAGLAPRAVDARRVAVMVGQVRQHGVEHLRPQRRGGGVVEVDAHGKSDYGRRPHVKEDR